MGDDGRISVLIPDGESHLTLNVVNCLFKEHLIDLYILSATSRNPVRFSRGVKKFIRASSYNDEEWLRIVNKTINEYKIDVLFPVFEKRIETIIKHQERILKSVNNILLPDLNSFNIANNKWFLHNHCRDNEINYPKSILFDLSKLSSSNTLTYPTVAKPISGYGGGRGVIVIRSEKDLNNYINKYDYKCKFIIQDFIRGYDIDCSVLCEKGELLAYTIQRGNLTGRTPFEPQVGLEFVNENRLLTVVKTLMQSLNWSGFAHIDCRYCIDNDEYYIIEINSRIWVSLDASYLAGVNFPLLSINYALNKKIDHYSYKCSTYLNIKGVLKTIKTGNRRILNAKYIMQNTQMRFALINPRPYVYKLFNRVLHSILNAG